MKYIIIILFSILLIYCKSGDTKEKLELKKDNDSTNLNLISIKDYQNFARKNLNTVQKFKVNNNKDNYIECKKGTILFLPANCLETDINSKEPVEIEITEYTTKSNIYFGNLSTLSDDKLLESNGMVYIQCFQNGKEISIKKDKKAAISFPKRDYENMKLFYGNKKNKKPINWKVQDPNEDKIIDNKNNVNSKKTVDRESFDYDYSLSIPQNQNYNLIWKEGKKSLNISEKFKENFVIPSELVDFLKNNLKYYLAFYFDVDTITGKIINVTAHPKNKTNKFSNKIIDFILSLPPASLEYCPKNRIVLSQEHYQFNIMLSEAYLDKIRAEKAKIENLKLELENEKMKLELEKKQKKIQKNTDEFLTSFSSNAFNKYSQTDKESFTFTIIKFGWINCDIFVNMYPMQSKDFVVPLTISKDLSGKIVFKELNSIIIGANNLNGEISFGRLPIGKKVLLIIEKTKNDSIFILSSEFETSKEPFDLKNLNPISLNDLNKKLMLY